MTKIYLPKIQNYYKRKYNLMKYLLCLATLSLGVVSQESISQKPSLISDINFVNPAISTDLEKMN